MLTQKSRGTWPDLRTKSVGCAQNSFHLCFVELICLIFLWLCRGLPQHIWCSWENTKRPHAASSLICSQSPPEGAPRSALSPVSTSRGRASEVKKQGQEELGRLEISGPVSREGPEVTTAVYTMGLVRVCVTQCLVAWSSAIVENTVCCVVSSWSQKGLFYYLPSHTSLTVHWENASFSPSFFCQELDVLLLFFF